MKGQKWLFLASWVLLLMLFASVGFLSLNSLRVAYSGQNDLLATVTIDGKEKAIGLEQIREIGGDAAVKAFKARRATAATFAFGYALLALFVVLFPYRRGEKWAWVALLLATLLSQLFSLARVFTLGTVQGSSASLIVLAIALLGLLAGAPHLFAKKPIENFEEVK
ncbi:MAG: hypothetical protein AB1757_14205 [Acidobacteriota bacterium]